MKIKSETVHRVQCNDLNAFVNSYYKINGWDFCCDHEAHNDSSYSFSINKEDVDDYDKSKMEKLKSGKEVSYMTRNILIDLCNLGVIPEGKYIIDVSW